MPDHDEDSLINLPAGLRGQFDEVGLRLWRVETATAVCAIIASLLLSWLLVLISDRIWDTPNWLRAFLLLCGLAGAGIAGIHWSRHWVWQRRDLRALATLVQKKYRRLGDRLLGIVELADEHKHSTNFSPALYQAAIEQVAAEAQKFDFLQSVNTRHARGFGAMSAGIAAGLLALCLLLPQAGWNSFLRWINPTGDTARYTLVALDGFPPEMIVPHGEPFAVSGNVHYLSFWKPGRVLGRLGLLTKTETAVQSNKIKLQIPGQLQKGVLEVRVGDATARIQILPSHRPSLERLSARVHLPEYLGYPDESEMVQNGSLRVLEGSRLGFRGTISRALAEAVVREADTNVAELQIHGPDFSSDDNEPSGMGEFTFTWRDQLGLTNAAPWRLSVRTQPDAPPIPDLPDLPRDTAMLATDVLKIHANAQDDFGVRDLGLDWDIVSDNPRATAMTTEAKVETSSTRQPKVEKDFKWSPSLYGVPQDSTVELQAFARDYFPDRARARTVIHTIRVLSPESHAELLRKDLENLMAQIEDVSRLQEKIVSDTTGVKEAGKAMPDAQQASHLSQSKESQLQNAQRLEELARQGAGDVREAMKNPDIPEETVGKWSETMQEWQKLSQQKMPEAARSLEAAAQSAKSPPPESSPSSPSSPAGQNPPSPGSPSQPSPPADAQRQKDLDHALQRAQDILDALRKMQQKANDTLDQMQAMTLAQRLRRVGENETTLDGELVTNLSDTLGLMPQELPEKLKKINLAFAKEQTGVHDESAALQGEISRFFERTQKTNYGHVSRDMKDSRAADEMDRIGLLIQSNITASTTLDLTNWAGRFQKWAEELSPKAGPPGGGGQGGSGPDLGKILTALLRLRGRELTLRDQTGLLEAAKQNAPDYKARAGGLASEQQALGEALEQIHRAAPIRALDTPFAQTGAAMSEAQKILAQPRTDAPAEAAEVKAVDNLTDLVNLLNEVAQISQGKPDSSAPGGTTPEQMAFLTRLMSQSAQMGPGGMTPGGSLSGGGTERTGHGVNGDVTGAAATARTVNKAAGAIESYPAEFRDALENYFHAVEKPSP